MANAANRNVLSTQRRREKDRAKRARDDVRAVMSTPSGRRVMWQLLSDAGIFRTSFTGNSETFFREGARSLGLKVFTQIQENAPDLYMLMAQEAQTENKADAEADILAAGGDPNEVQDDG